MNIELQQFHASAERFAEAAATRNFARGALKGSLHVRAGTQAQFEDYEAAREAAAAIKWDAVEHLDQHLISFTENLERRGVRVHWCQNGDEARAAILNICKAAGAKKVIKSKCMTTEEIHLNDALEAAGYEVVESDLGEYIQQLRKEHPFHFVFPSMHLRREQIATLFNENLGIQCETEPEKLTMVAREVMREKFLAADVGISGANFAVADTGMISITENEGNARLTTSMPRIHIAVLGIEKIVPRLEDLALLLPMLATNGTGQHLTGYNTLMGGPRREGEPDGPREMHVVLLDNHRTEMLADPEVRDALRCIRCGACLNVCPVFHSVGGLTYGTTYQGPIGSVITPHLRHMKDWNHLSYASSLCGACTAACPVKIDLHHHLLRNRRDAVAEGHKGFIERLAMRGFAFAMRRPWVYRISGTFAKAGSGALDLLAKVGLDPLKKLREQRDLPRPAPESFKAYWEQRQRQ